MTEPEKVLTEAEAWREIARLFAEGEADCGMCWEARLLCLDGRITGEQEKTMHRRIYAHTAGSWIFEEDAGMSTGPWSFDSNDKEVRVLAALFLALEAEEDV